MYTQRYESLCRNVNYPLIKKLKKEKVAYTYIGILALKRKKFCHM